MRKVPIDQTAREYADFVSGQESLPAPSLSELTIRQVEETLNPAPLKVLIRLGIIIFIVGILNLTLCPQFGLGFVKESGIFELFMSFGHHTCKLFCGAFFLGTGVFLSALILRVEDLKVLHRHKLLQLSALSSIALTFFVAAGGAVYFTAALYWFTGALIGGLLSLEIGLRFRSRFA